MIEPTNKQNRSVDDAVNPALEQTKSFANLPGEDFDALGETNMEATLQYKPIVTADHPDDLMTEVDRFQIVAPHARGGLGVVNRAKDRQLGREVALKEIRSELAADRTIQHQFVREAKITGSLEHPGVVPVYALGADSRQLPIYAMRFIRGESLDAAIKKYHQIPPTKTKDRRLRLRKLLQQFLDICNTMEYAHSRGIIHRDLKPQNIMVGDYGETLVVDWGLAIPLEDQAGGMAPHSDGSTIVGTPVYMSPEQAEGKPVSAVSDVYCLGGILFAILTGKPAVHGTTLDEVITRVRSGNVDHVQQIEPSAPGALAAIATKGLNRDPSGRYQSARALAEDVESYLADEKVSAYRESVIERSARWLRRHRTMATGLGTALILLLLVSVAASIVLGAANRRERALKDEAQTQQERAEHHLITAQSAVGDFLYRVANDPQLQSQGLESLQHELLRSGSKRLEELLAFETKNPELRRAQNNQQYYLMLAAYRLGDWDQTLETANKFTQSLGGQDVPSEQKPRLVQCYSMRGIVHNIRGENAAAEKCFRQGEELVAGFLKDDPDNLKLLAVGAELFINWRGLAARTGQHAKRKSLDKQLVLFSEKIEKLNPQEPEFQIVRQLLRAKTGRDDLGKVSAEQLQQVIRDLKTELAKQPDNQRLSVRVAEHLRKLGEQLAEDGKPTEGRQHIVEAVEIMEKLKADHPDVVKYGDELRLAHMHLGIVLFNEDQFNEAEPHLKKMVDRAMEKDAALDAFDRRLSMQARLYYAKLLRQRSNVGDAKKHLAEIRKTCERWQQKSPDDLSPKFLIADAEGTLGEIERDEGHADEAIIHFRTSMDRSEALLAREPQSANYLLLWSRYALLFAKLKYLARQFEEAKHISEQIVVRLTPLVRPVQTQSSTFEFLVRAHNLAAEILRKQNQFEAAILRCDTSLKRIEEWKNGKPSNRQSLKGTALATQILALQSSGQPEAALERIDEAVEIADPPIRAVLKDRIMILLLEAGKYPETLVAANAWRKDSSETVQATRTFQVVIFLSGALKRLENDATLPPSRREVLEADFANRAVELLMELDKVGLFKTSKNEQVLKTRSDLEPLRQRKEYQSWWRSRTNETDDK